MTTPLLIALDDVVLRHDLDPRLGDRDDDLIRQYADIFDALPPIEINQDKEVIDGWHRVLAARHVDVAKIACVVVETADDDDLADRMWEANLRHGVQYSRDQRKTHGLKLHGRELTVKAIAERVGVSAATVRRWTKALREEEKRIRDERIIELAETNMSLRQIAEEVAVDDKTVGNVLRKNAQMREIPHGDSAAETLEGIDVAPEEAPDDAEASMLDSGSGEEFEPTQDELREEGPVESETDETPVEETSESASELESELADEPQEEMEVASAETDMNDTLAEEKPNTSEPESESETDEVSNEESAAPESGLESEPALLDPIPDDILRTARAVMVAFTETRPDGYVARLEATEDEWMTITDDSLSNELERELLNSAAAMCLWDEWMIWYQGEHANSFTDAFGKIGPVFVRGQSGQWSIVSRLRSLLRRMWG